MILNFAEEAAKRRDRTLRSGQYKPALSNPRRAAPVLPQVEFGSGWYHSEAVKDESRNLFPRD